MNITSLIGISKVPEGFMVTKSRAQSSWTWKNLLSRAQNSGEQIAAARQQSDLSSCLDYRWWDLVRAAPLFAVMISVMWNHLRRAVRPPSLDLQSWLVMHSEDLLWYHMKLLHCAVRETLCTPWDRFWVPEPGLSSHWSYCSFCWREEFGLVLCFFLRITFEACFFLERFRSSPLATRQKLALIFQDTKLFRVPFNQQLF